MINRAVILSTGDELTSGRVVDTNSSIMAAEFAALGVETVAVLKIGDDRERLLWALRQAHELGDLIIGSGGLGPTADDLSTETVAQFLGRRLHFDDQTAESLKKRIRARGLSWTENTVKQAYFPEGATIVPNPSGTAPGFRIASGDGQTLIWLSGVPQEMVAMLKESVLPWIAEQRSEGGRAFGLTFKIHGITESKLDDLLKSVDLGANAKLSFRAHYPDLSLRLTVQGDPDGENVFSRVRNEIRAILGTYVYAEGDVTLEEIVGSLLLSKKQTLALAESCTGGYISHRITRIAGSSAYYIGGAVTYSNEMKIRLLGVRNETLEQHGAVSRETALQMSKGVRRRMGASVGVGVTGIAGPGGATPGKPVGTVWISIATETVHEAQLFNFYGDRERIILGASQAALNWLRVVLS